MNEDNGKEETSMLIAGDDPNYDNFLSQFAASLVKYDGGDWFGRLVGWSPGENGQKLEFRVNGELIPMFDIIHDVKYRQLHIAITNIRLPALPYVVDGNGVITATMTADITVTDNRGNSPLTSTRNGVTIINKIKKTYTSYNATL